MKLEKRSEGQPSEAPEETPEKGKKPVLVYIMILFIAAFLLMALSFASHQRSNTEALGELQNSVSAMQEVQATQDQIIRLQQQLAEAARTIEDLEDAAGEDRTALDNAQKRTEALLSLYALQQHYSNQNYDACREVIAAFEDQGAAAYLPKERTGGVTPPFERYKQLKSAVEALAPEE